METVNLTNGQQLPRIPAGGGNGAGRPGTAPAGGSEQRGPATPEGRGGDLSRAAPRQGAAQAAEPGQGRRGTPDPGAGKGDGGGRPGVPAEQVRQQLNEALKRMNVGVDFNINRDLDQVVVEVVNRETHEVIRQVPPEEMLEMAKRMEELSGVLLDERR